MLSPTTFQIPNDPAKDQRSFLRPYITNENTEQRVTAFCKQFQTYVYRGSILNNKLVFPDGGYEAFRPGHRLLVVTLVFRANVEEGDTLLFFFRTGFHQLVSTLSLEVQFGTVEAVVVRISADSAVSQTCFTNQLIITVVSKWT